MNAQPFFSFLIPSFKSEETILKCVESIYQQDYKNYEVIICDQGDTDSSFLLSQFPTLKIIHRQNPSAYQARVDLYKEAKGKYILFPDADDYYTGVFLSKLHEIILLTNFSDLYYFYSTKDKHEDGNFSYKKIGKEIFLNEFLTTYSLNFVSTKCYKKRLDIDFYDIELNKSSDQLLNVSLLNNIDTVYEIDKIIYHYSINDNSITRKYSIKQVNDTSFTFLKMVELFKLENYQLQDSFDNQLVGVLRLCLELYVKNGILIIDNLNDVPYFCEFIACFKKLIHFSNVKRYWKKIFNSILKKNKFVFKFYSLLYRLK